MPGHLVCALSTASSACRLHGAEGLRFATAIEFHRLDASVLF